MARVMSPEPNQSAGTHSNEQLDRELDQANEHTFPASDPVSLVMPHQRVPEEGTRGVVRGPRRAAALPLLIVCGIILALWLRRPTG